MYFLYFTLPESPRSRFQLLSLCTTTTHTFWLNPTLQNKTAPTVSMSSATGRPLEYAGFCEFLSGSQFCQGHPPGDRCLLLSFLSSPCYEFPWILFAGKALLCGEKFQRRNNPSIPPRKRIRACRLRFADCKPFRVLC